MVIITIDGLKIQLFSINHKSVDLRINSKAASIRTIHQN